MNISTHSPRTAQQMPERRASGQSAAPANPPQNPVDRIDVDWSAAKEMQSRGPLTDPDPSYVKTEPERIPPGMDHTWREGPIGERPPRERDPLPSPSSPAPPPPSLLDALRSCFGPVTD